MPCLDPANTAGGAIGDDTFAAYASQDFTLGETFPNGDTFDPGVDYSLNCIQDIDQGAGWVGVGQDNGTTFIQRGTSDGGPARFAAIAPDGTVDLWYVNRGVASGFDTATGTERHGPGTLAAAGNLTYEGTTGVIHAKADGTTDHLELTATGTGLGDGCGFHLQTDGDLLFYTANRNRYGRCSDSDFQNTGLVHVKDVDGDGTISPAEEFGEEGEFEHVASLVNVAYCYDVSGALAEEVNLEDCSNRGLGFAVIENTDDPTSLFEESTLSMPTLKREQIKAFNALHLLNTRPTNLPEFASFEAPPASTTTQPGLSDEIPIPPAAAPLTLRTMWFRQDHPNSVNFPSAGHCRDVILDQEDFTIRQRLDIGPVNPTTRGRLENSPVVAVLLNVNNSFGSRSTGSFGWSEFSGATVTITNNGTPIAGIAPQTFNAENPTNTTAPDGVQPAVFTFPAGFDWDSIGSLGVTFTGTQHYQCGTEAAPSEPFSRMPALGRVQFVYFFAP